MPNTDFFISPAYCVPPIRISFSEKFTAITVSVREPCFAGSARKLGRSMIVYSVAKDASSSAVGRQSSVRMNWLCQANSVMTCTPTRYSGCEPPNSCWRYTRSRDARWAKKSALSAAK